MGSHQFHLLFAQTVPPVISSCLPRLLLLVWLVLVLARAPFVNDLPAQRMRRLRCCVHSIKQLLLPSRKRYWVWLLSLGTVRCYVGEEEEEAEEKDGLAALALATGSG